MKIKILLLSTGLFLTSCKTELRVSPISSSTKLNGTNKGITYALPKKEYYLEVKVLQITKKTGKLYDSKCLEEIKKVISGDLIASDSQEYEFISANLKNYVLPDENKEYFVDIKDMDKAFIQSKLNFEFSDLGIIKTGSVESDNKSAEFIIKAGTTVLTTAVNLASSLSFSGLGNIQSIKELTPVKESAPVKSSLLCESTLESLKKLIEQKKNILFCKACDQCCNKTEMLQLLKQEENKLLALLVGTKTTDTLIYKIELDNLFHKDAFSKTIPLFTITKSGGLVLPSYYTSGTAPLGMAVNARISSINMQSTTSGYGSVGGTPATGTSGIKYNIPNVCKIQIFDSSNPHDLNIETIESVPQLGIVAALPKGFKKKKVAQSFSIDQKTGALTSYSISTEPLDKSSFDPAYSTVEKLTETLKESKTKKATDEIKEQIELIKAQKELQDLKSDATEK